MRKIGVPKIVLLAVLLSLVAFIVNLTATKLQKTAKEPLNAAFVTLPGWTASSAISMGTNIVEALQLDDYLFKTFQRNKDKVSLYIGYYRSAANVGAAHDPLVCFTGQGWRIVEKREGKYSLSGPKNLSINYSSMIAERDSEKELLIYWFQTNGSTSAGTFGQKIQMLWQRLRKVPREENAFVRLSTRLEGDAPALSQKRIIEFIDVFYPEFYRYVGK